MENHNGGVKTKLQMADEYGVCFLSNTGLPKTV
jgi:hypothetical protein